MGRSQVHMSWPFLARPSDEPHAVGLLSLRLETTWFSTLEDHDQHAGQGQGGTGQGQDQGQGQGQGQAADSPSSAGSGSGAGSVEEWGQASGGRRGPLQWDEEKAVLFIQVSVS